MTATSLGAEPTTTPPVARRLLAMGPAERWSEKAPKSLKASDPGAGDGWNAWREHLKRRKAHGSKILGALKHDPLLWGHADPAWSDWLGELSHSARSKKVADASLQAKAQEWVSQSRSSCGTLRHALECLAWAGLLPQLAERFEPEVWWALCDELLATSEEGALGAENALPEASLPESVLLHQVVAGELPLVLACLLPEIKPLHSLAASARNTLSEGLLAWTDGEGVLHAKLLSVAPMLFACWTRCRAAADHKSKGAWSEDAETQYEWLVRQGLRLVDREGAFPFAVDGAGAGMIDCFKTALLLAGDDADWSAAAQRLRGLSPMDDDDPPSPANHSEWSGLGVLACGWGAKAPKIVVACNGSDLQLEVHNRGAKLLAGGWPIEVRAGGAPLKPSGEWDCTCWHSDEDCDYLDVSIDLEGGYELERQIMLAREDGVATFTEVVLGGDRQAEDLSLLGRFPLTPGVAFKGEQETREGWLEVNGKRNLGVVPLSLPEWRAEQRVGECAQTDDQSLEVGCAMSGRNLASVLWLDFSPSRFSKQRTWRQLTVAQALMKVSSDVAVGYRVQAGKRQWLIYRSLDPPANRTVLGHNLSTEAITGRFLPTGEVDEYFEIGDDDD